MSALFLLLATASGATWDAQVAVDALAATSTSDADFAGEGTLAAADTGITVRGELQELDDRLEIGVDYRGRVPLAGAFPNREQHLLYRADVAWRFSDKVEVGAGRFFAPSATWLAMDGARASLRAGPYRAIAFAGRRGISLSRRNLPLDAFLPVVGGQVARTTDGLHLDVSANLAGDRLVLGNPGDEVEEDVIGGSAQARFAVTRFDRWRFGGQASLSQRATYALGPTAGEYVLTAQALAFYQALAWTQWRPSSSARVDATVVHQQVTVVPDPEQIPIVDPSFTNLRVRATFGKQLAFVRPDVRLRLRRERTELRWGGTFEVPIPGVRGPFVFGRGWLEHVFDEPAFIDRSLGQIGAGWERGAGLLEAGVGVIDRAAGPVSGRPGASFGATPLVSEDLGPFVLESQNVAFVRGFLTGRRWFVGTDVEANLLDGEVRGFLQVGLLVRRSS